MTGHTHISRIQPNLTGCFMLAVLLLVTALPEAAAYQIREGQQDRTITGVISASEVNRILFRNDRARLVSGSGEVDVTNDAESGSLYLKLKDQYAEKPVNLFVTTENGFTYQLLLIPENVPSEQIVIEEATDSAAAVSWEKKAPYQTTIAMLVRAMVLEDIPPGYAWRSPEIGLDDLLFSGLWGKGVEVRDPAILSGGVFEGMVLEVVNHTDRPVELGEARFYRPGILATYIPRRHLAPGDSGLVYNVFLASGLRGSANP